MDTGLDATKLTQCQRSLRGPQLLKAMGDRTAKLNPKMVFVPWMLFDDRFGQKDQQAGLYDLRKVICSKMLEKPEGC